MNIPIVTGISIFTYKKLKRHIFDPNVQHPKVYTLSISSLILHFYHFLPCLIIPWISSCSISNSISQNVISSQPFHPHLKCLLFHPCIFHPISDGLGTKNPGTGQICVMVFRVPHRADRVPGGSEPGTGRIREIQTPKIIWKKS